MRPVAVTLAAGVLALTLTGCGSSSRVEVRSPPRLPRPVADALAARADAVAAALRLGEACVAKAQVHRLERATRSAVAAGRVPGAYRPRLRAAIEQLAARIPRCVPPPAPPAPAPPPPAPPAPVQPKPKPKQEKHGDHHGKKHGKGEGD